MSQPNDSTIIPFAERHWWKEAIVYQIYPASFCDANGDGLGDLKGITSKVPYLKQLGVNAIWLCPIYKSPQHDMGYDISDYRDIYEPYGTMDDFDELLKTMHEHGLKLIMDLVVNHCSSEHEWFIESKSSKQNPKRDWFIWRKGKVDENGQKVPPNNWKSVFGAGPAWTYDEGTDEWYLRLFVSQQPDLNWENPEVRQAVYDLMKFWLDKGVDGFRMDVINLISKVPGLPDAEIEDPDSKYQPGFKYTANGPKMHDYLREMNAEVLSKYDVLTVGETPFTHDPKVLIQYIRKDELQMVFQFEMHDLDGGDAANPMKPSPFKLTQLKQIIGRWQKAMFEGNGWNSIYFGNHDQARLVSRFTSDAPEYRARSAKLLALNQLTLSGTPYVYQGEDIGMSNVPQDWGFEEYKDVATLQWIDGMREKRQKSTGQEKPDLTDLLAWMRAKARDNARTPMQWDSSKNAGFSSADQPWMRVHDDYKQWNVQVQSNDPDSVNAFYKQLFNLRNEHLVLVYGSFDYVEFDNEEVFAYVKEHEGEKVLVVLNYTGKNVNFAVPDSLSTGNAKLILGTLGKGAIENGKVALEAWEGMLFKL
ncbi:hypothetical protein NliqN6_5688 [Naganishia liquefaciens]|uniref:Glycosyl hydrolase family 13 catalytic domain-containing protein n=1 Tax=Naganishia liquefaciens TaxID=104408 RepID=A0A8H3TYL9_9TREE|nr:hypothetical protein NliqN6_5688 [Naganishia liquefaciens]